jgi:hypothetical protein
MSTRAVVLKSKSRKCNKSANTRATCKTAESEFIYGQIGQEKRKTPALK